MSREGVAVQGAVVQAAADQVAAVHGAADQADVGTAVTSEVPGSPVPGTPVPGSQLPASEPPASPLPVERLFLGIDGCRGGWICARWNGADLLHISRVERLADLFPSPPFPVVAIDMPIGLPERAGPGGREAERLVRPLLGGRQSSVFSVPSRAAVMAGLQPGEDEGKRYRAACAAALTSSDPPRAVAKQCFHLFPKMGEVDALLRERSELVEQVHECHPEVAFWAMNDGQPLPLPKKVKNRPHLPGLELRRSLLASRGIPVDALSAQTALALRAGLDDLIDACACAWSAKRVAYGKALRFPDPPGRDTLGLPICICA
ncbi:DUF429 domain-containing protein [Xanthobacter variabilis]|uniref:DUF429 domain-containing protein n=1 Tax=Xanthobacter variabilis TaxID=3119932 RepID=UPI003728CA04